MYDQLRSQILSGELSSGHRLPPEVALASGFGVSRGTIREALRLLVAEGLIRTLKGATGGNFVTLPTVDHISEFMQRNIDLLSRTELVTLPEFLDARELIEVYAVRHVAERHTEAGLDALRATLAVESVSTAHEKFLQNKEFHQILVDACGNTLLQIAAQPIFSILHTNLGRSKLTDEFPRRVCSEHRAMLDAISAGDADRAEALMRQHLADLALVYRQIWHSGVDLSNR
ncbi:HTH-type transcriptional regulator LutR [Capillimicrobium parvum]|uniref:HTH-type transcriptional regulator LutR n=1 Tax=Capillimicrobium parvum TaxID=2884022 RepID=A0A9E7C323_9ACTN|nr:HTH-type transcriptional regulator LutR [Capillimicrobium parvum]